VLDGVASAFDGGFAVAAEDHVGISVGSCHLAAP